MFAWMLVPALAGELEVTVRTDEGTKETLKVDQALACQRAAFETRAEGTRMSVAAEVRPASEGEWLVYLEVEGRRLGEGEGYQEVKLSPALRVADGKRATMSVQSQGHEVALDVKVKGFDPSDCEVVGRTSQRREVRTEP